MKHDLKTFEQQCALTTFADNDFSTFIFIGVAPTSSAIHSIPGL